ncbi:Fe-Mn family superoxide dismutase [Paenibacillus mucilaginosus]|uniref:Fe-Mn family superoxide dismutase n=1 Tax=Paenibacillus mucilaginosus TaxID=61624 RepID=UPI003D1ACF15
MQYAYGALTPLRLLEETRFWKGQEREHTVVIRELAPALEPDYKRLLQEWEVVLARTETSAGRWIEALLRRPAPASPVLRQEVRRFLEASAVQSQAFVRQLHLLMERSRTIRTQPPLRAILLHLIRESEYFLGVLQAAAGGPGAYEEGLSGGSFAPDDAQTGQEGQGEPDGHLLSAHDTGGDPAEAQPPEEPYDSSGATATQEGVWTMGIRPVPAYAKPVPIGGHRLPPLPYPYDALEPHIDKETMRLHHTKHHLSYVEGLNKAELALARAREIGDYALVKHWERETAFHGAGHYLHTLFWQVMKPGGGGPPTGTIAADLKKSFGGFSPFRKQFSAAAEKVEGGGWALLVWSPRSHRLEILQAEKHQNLSQWDVIPLLVLDVWEHAYYVRYRNDRARYIEAWWNTIHWEHVNERLEAARGLKWPPF